MSSLELKRVYLSTHSNPTHWTYFNFEINGRVSEGAWGSEFSLQPCSPLFSYYHPLVSTYHDIKMWLRKVGTIFISSPMQFLIVNLMDVHSGSAREASSTDHPRFGLKQTWFSETVRFRCKTILEFQTRLDPGNQTRIKCHLLLSRDLILVRHQGKCFQVHPLFFILSGIWDPVGRNSHSYINLPKR